ncbi:uncharacterized protein [Choristoneura fumiferana]|uniref:uncharacterized protein n=1 Tax=Choristoneura fumiferana TaxID=7141 RepID=UPI003D155E5E
MMENVDLPPPYSAAVNVSTPSPDVLTTQQEASKQTIDAEPLVPEPLVAHPFDDKFARLAFMQKILLFLLLQALSVLAIMALIANYWYYHQPIYSYVFLCLYLFMLGLLFFSDTARTKHPYKAVLFTAYPIIFAIFISFSTLYSIREMFVAWSCYCVALFALLAYSILIFQTSLEYRPGGGIFISTVVLASLYALTTQIVDLDTKTTFFSCYMTAMLADCAYTVWAVFLITSPKYRYTVTPSDIILGVLLIRIDFIHYILMYIKKLWQYFAQHVESSYIRTRILRITSE